MATWVVVTKGGVAYRNTAKYTDRVTTFRGPEFGSEVQALGDTRSGVDEGVTWIQTEKGWIPIRTLDGNEVIKRKEQLTKSDVSMIKRSKEEDEDDGGRSRSSSVVAKADLWLSALQDEAQTEAIEDTALIAAAGGYVQAIQHSGEPLWTVEGELKQEKCVSLLSRAPIFGGIKAVYAAAHGVLLAISATDGSMIWRADLTQLYKGPCTMALDFAGERLFCASQGRVMGLCANTGRALWTANLTRTGYDVVSLLAAKLSGLKDPEQLFCASRGRVFCFSGVKGKVRWTTTMKLSAKCFMCLATHEDRVQNRSRLLFSTHGRIGALDTTNGRVIWEIRVPKLKTHHTLAPVVLDDDVAFFCVAGNVLAIFAKTGQQKWEKDLFGSEMLEVEQGAICMDRPKKMIYIALCQHVVALDINNGEVKWSVYVQQIRCTQPCLYLAFDDLLYVSGAGHVRCIDTLTGSLAQGFDPELGAEMTTTALSMTHPTQGNQDHNVNPNPQSWAINKAIPTSSVRDFSDETKRLTIFLGDMKRADHKAVPKAAASRGGTLDSDEDDLEEDSDEDILQQVPSRASGGFGQNVTGAAPAEEEEEEESSDEDNYDDEEDPFALDFVPTKKSPKEPKAAEELDGSSDDELERRPAELKIAPEDDSSEEDEDPFAYKPASDKQVVATIERPVELAPPAINLEDDFMSLMAPQPVAVEPQQRAPTSPGMDLMGFAASPQPVAAPATAVQDLSDPFAITPAPAAPVSAPAPAPTQMMMSAPAAPTPNMMMSAPAPQAAPAPNLMMGGGSSFAPPVQMRQQQPQMAPMTQQNTPMMSSPFSTQPMMPPQQAQPFGQQPMMPQQPFAQQPRQGFQASPFAQQPRQAPSGLMQPQGTLMQPTAKANPFGQRPAAPVAQPQDSPAPARPNPFGGLVASQRAAISQAPQGIPSHMPSTPRLGLFQQ